ncbi:Uncharacterized protein BC141101_05624 [Bacillus toyonensis]|uniref:Uncharacterized protein n=1 Tax=Bacillus cereus TaxID=1396 RepID=A0A5F0X0G9_BACCE|nr:hypothetical protein BW897_25565 [Bacillus cereus]TFZ09420.1 hypothetical protein C6Y54_28670 [Bacillus cereus]SCN20264.1 Uncharacterized protein BC141101_05624 [Bacillus toyonensis]
MPFIGFLPTLGNPILGGIVISIVMLVLIGYSIHKRKWEVFITCLLVWILLVLIVVFPQEIGELAPTLLHTSF